MKRLLLFLGIFFSLFFILLAFLNQVTPKELPKPQIEFFSSPSPQPLVLGFAGEIILARDVATKINQYKDYRCPFYKVADLTRNIDLFFATLEAPLTGKNIPCGIDCMKFIGDAQAIEGLTFAGIDVVSLAANHIMDGGEKGLADTLEVLDQNGIAHTGAGLTPQEARKPVIKEVNRVKFGFVAYNDIYPKENTATAENLTQEINDLKKAVDLVIVAFHWGTEYATSPTFRQKELAHKAIKAGADLVVGDHPHVLQGIEFYQSKPIFYSVGNFVFDQMWSRETREGIIGLLTFSEQRLVKMELLPFQIEDFSQPQLLEEKETKLLLNKLFSISDPESVAIIKSLE